MLDLDPTWAPHSGLFAQGIKKRKHTTRLLVRQQDEPAADRAEAKGIPTPGNAVEDCLAANSKLSK